MEKVVVTATATTAHGLGIGDTISFGVLPGITTAYSIKYNDHNRKATVGLSTFLQTDVNTSSNTIDIINHGLRTGDKVIYESTNVVSGLSSVLLVYGWYYWY